MTLLEELSMRVVNDHSVHVDLKKKSLIVDGKHWVKDGKVTEAAPSKDLVPDVKAFPKSLMERLEDLYHEYKYSYPSETETKRKRNYFKALSADEMTDEEMVHGLDRTLTRVILEAMVLLHTLSGDLKWRDEWGSWFYQGKKDKDFILLREWIE